MSEKKEPKKAKRKEVRNVNMEDIAAALKTRGIDVPRPVYMLKTVFDLIAGELCIPDTKVSLPGIGYLRSSVRPAQNVRNVRTGEIMMASEKNQVKFKAGIVLKKRANGQE